MSEADTRRVKAKALRQQPQMANMWSQAEHNTQGGSLNALKDNKFIKTSHRIYSWIWTQSASLKKCRVYTIRQMHTADCTTAHTAPRAAVRFVKQQTMATVRSLETTLEHFNCKINSKQKRSSVTLSTGSRVNKDSNNKFMSSAVSSSSVKSRN